MTQLTRRGQGTALLVSGIMLAAGALAGCGSAAGGGTTAGTSSATPDDETMSIVTCYRTHGDPSFPDPVYDPSDGRWHFAISPGSAPASTQQACQHLFPSSNASPPVPQAQFQKLVRYAECIRQHGVPNWPDPDPDGSFPLPSSINPKDAANQAAGTACQRYLPSSGHIDVHIVS
ncbi:hypothetical protein [Trebonia kvetii]|uniref:hypothetical protein n=1 Tax=Trebonia kvetii TaxID=2480626 RepID=UPI00165210BE|nr:hypothetical protein [Trebonia kvetii]